jgi:hypothetical protein
LGVAALVDPGLGEAHLLVPARQVAAPLVLRRHGDLGPAELEAGLGRRGDQHLADAVAALALVDAEIGDFDHAPVAGMHHDRADLPSAGASGQPVAAGAGIDWRRNPYR